MKNNKYIMFTAGRGPIECALAVQGIQNKFKKFLDNKNIDYKIVSQKKGQVLKSLETIVFELNTNESVLIKPWIGTLKWICQSPVRKFHKRKNWFVKCEEIFISNKIEFNLSDISIQTFRASGPGGQHRNKVETAIRVIHKSSGITVTATDAKSQIQNKKKAMNKLKEKLEERNTQFLKDFDADQWTSQLVIERGAPVKTFIGKLFVE